MKRKQETGYSISNQSSFKRRLLPESGRWLLSKGRQEEAKDVLEFTAKRNGIGYPVEMIRRLANDESADANAKQANILDLLRDVNMARLSIIIWFGWYATNSDIFRH